MFFLSSLAWTWLLVLAALEQVFWKTPSYFCWEALYTGPVSRFYSLLQGFQAHLLKNHGTMNWQCFYQLPSVYSSQKCSRNRHSLVFLPVEKSGAQSGCAKISAVNGNFLDTEEMRGMNNFGQKKVKMKVLVFLLLC